MDVIGYLPYFLTLPGIFLGVLVARRIFRHG
jgi:hypothetical protein